MLVDKIVHNLKNKITTGAIGPGRKLPSPDELQSQFGVGKSTIREALKILEGMGLVRVKKGRTGGAFVISIDDQKYVGGYTHPTQLDHSCLLTFIGHRRSVEPNLIARACNNRHVKHLEKMRAAINLLKDQPRNKENYIHASRQLFSSIAEATGNNFSGEAFRHFAQLFATSSSLLYETNNCFEISILFYPQILEAIESKDSGKGLMLGEAYLAQVEQYVHEHAMRANRSIGTAKTIKWGVIADLSGPTSAHGNQSVMGMIDAARYINDNGGILGNELELVVRDSGYTFDKSVKAYREMLRIDGLSGAYVQSTGTTISLAEYANKDRMLLFTAAISDKLSSPAKFPYHFSLGPTYADMARICVHHMRQRWTDSSRKPRLVFIYPDNAYGRDPLGKAKPYAQSIGMEVGPDQIVNWPTLDATPQLLSMGKFDPDFVFVTSTALHTAAILRDSKRVKTRAKFYLNIRAFNEELPRLSMGAEEGVYGVQVLTPYGVNVPGMQKIVKAHDDRHKFHKPSIAYVEGWANILAPMEGCKIAAESGELNTEGIKKALETFDHFELGGLMPPITYSAQDHSGCTQARISQMNKGSIVPIADNIEISNLG